MTAIWRRIADTAAAVIADVEDELQNMGDANKRWAVFGALIVVGFVAFLMAERP